VEVANHCLGSESSIESENEICDGKRKRWADMHSFHFGSVSKALAGLVVKASRHSARGLA